MLISKAQQKEITDLALALESERYEIMLDFYNH
jgi:hypothetical protein